MENETLAMELLREVKHSARRWFIAFIIMVVLELLTIVGFVIYVSIPTEEYYVEQDTGQGGDNYNIGGNYNGTSTDQLQEAR